MKIKFLVLNIACFFSTITLSAIDCKIDTVKEDPDVWWRTQTHFSGAFTDLQPVLINPGEAVLVNFMDSRLYRAELWNIHDGSAHGLVMQTIYQDLTGASFLWSKPAVNAPCLCMERDFNVSVEGYDKIMVGARLPNKARLVVSVQTDRGLLEQTFEKMPDYRREYELPLQGAGKLTHIKLSVLSEETGSQGAGILWLILQNEQKLADYYRSLIPYGKKWEGHIKGEDYQPQFIPTYGIVFGKDHMENLRKRYGANANSSAIKMLQIDPEDLLIESVGRDARFTRDRHLDKIFLTPSSLAIAGILTKNKEMLRMAARYAMTLAVTPHWDEGFMAHFPGSPWTHAAFRESNVVHELALTLDLAGEMFTDEGREFILKRLTIEGLGHTNFITWRHEYIHHMNQMAAFSHGRILGYAVLEKTMPRVKPYLDLAYQDLVNNLQIAIEPDGSSLEGPNYLAYTISEAGLALHYYAMARGKSLIEVTPSHLLRTADFAEAFYSTAIENIVIPVCDAHPHFGVGVCNFLTAISNNNSRWIDIKRKELDGRVYEPDLLSLVIPQNEMNESPAMKTFVFLPEMGIMTSTRRLGNEWLKILIQGNKANAGHTHEDKGSFVIEFAGETFAGDYGVSNYADAMTFISKQCQWHNMLIPLSDDERPAPDNPVTVDVKPVGEGDALRFKVSIDVTQPWMMFFNRNIRTWDSPSPEQLVITDDYDLKRKSGVEFNWQTMLPVVRKGNKIVIEGNRGIAEIHIPSGTTCRIEHHLCWTGKIVNRIIFSKKGQTGKMETKVTFKLKN